MATLETNVAVACPQQGSLSKVGQESWWSFEEDYLELFGDVMWLNVAQQKLADASEGAWVCLMVGYYLALCQRAFLALVYEQPLIILDENLNKDCSMTSLPI